MSGYKERMATRHAEKQRVQAPAYQVNLQKLHQLPVELRPGSQAPQVARCYIAGAITGQEELASERFAEMKARIQRHYPDLEVISPMEDLGLTIHDEWETCLAVCIYALMKCQRIHMMEGWGSSKGARLEWTIARHLGLMTTYDKHAAQEIPAAHNTTTP